MRKENPENNPLDNFDFNKDMRRIGKPYYHWQILKRKKLILKFIVSRNTKKRATRRPTVIFEEENQRKKSKFVIHPESRFSIITDLITDCAYVYSFFFVLLIIGSRMSLLPQMRLFEIIVDFILFIDMILNFFTAYEINHQYVLDLNIIATRYATNMFIFDFIGIVPGLLSFELLPALYPLKM